MPSFFRGNDSHGPRIHPQRVTLARSPNTFVDNSCGSVGKRCRMSVTIPSLGMNAVPMVSNPLGIAVVGCGYWGTNYVDRKSTRLNSSYVSISYAVFCLTKKKPMQKKASMIETPCHDNRGLAILYFLLFLHSDFPLALTLLARSCVETR